jgi:hypothetical protein
VRTAITTISSTSDAEHEELMKVIAARLGFDLVSLKLELFGRRRDAPDRELDEADGA